MLIFVINKISYHQYSFLYSGSFDTAACWWQPYAWMYDKCVFYLTVLYIIYVNTATFKCLYLQGKVQQFATTENLNHVFNIMFLVRLSPPIIRTKAVLSHLHTPQGLRHFKVTQKHCLRFNYTAEPWQLCDQTGPESVLASGCACV